MLVVWNCGVLEELVGDLRIGFGERMMKQRL